MQLTTQQITKFQKMIYTHYSAYGRTFSWRETTNPYHIFVSEVMLQQTQTSRVAKKYEAFLTTFPDFESLAKAPLHEVLQAWQGLGYNRRAKFLQQSAQTIISEYDGNIPHDPKKLVSLPGIGKATAGSIAAFAFNAPTIFAETNIKVVFMHLFLFYKEKVSDDEILALVTQTLDSTSPRIWYYALTDYGYMLKSNGINPISKSKSYTKQSKFEGSDRQIRGVIIRELLQYKTQNLEEICKTLNASLNAQPERITKILHALVQEKLINQKIIENKKKFFV